MPAKTTTTPPSTAIERLEPGFAIGGAGPLVPDSHREVTMADTAQYLTLGIDQELFGIDIRNVREILDMRPISKLPHAPNFLLGMIDVRGAGYPIVDLRTKLGLVRAEPTEATRIIILDVPVKGRTLGVGFVADRVFEVTGLDDDQTEAAPDVGGRWQSNYIAGIGRKGESFIVVFDLERLMETDDLPAFAGAPAEEAA
jgi:purine-binding chemotaxis protein CheW